MTVHLLIQSALAWLVLLVACSALVEMLRPLVWRRVRRAAADGRLSWCVAWCWLPVWMATALLAGCYAPWALAGLGWSHDHCNDHGGHIHLCLQHVLAADMRAAAWLLLGAIGAWLALGAGELLGDVRRSRDARQALDALAGGPDGLNVVDADVPWSVTVGIWSPRIFVTSALLRMLSSEARQAVLAHERCHARERHALAKLVAMVGALVFRPSTRRALLGQVALACERRSDEHAAQAVGDRLEVAAALLTARRALGRHLPLGVLAFDDAASSFETRIRGLAAPPPVARGSWARFGIAVCGVAGLAVWSGHALHHEVETLLSLFVH